MEHFGLKQSVSMIPRLLKEKKIIKKKKSSFFCGNEIEKKKKWLLNRLTS